MAGSQRSLPVVFRTVLSCVLATCFLFPPLGRAQFGGDCWRRDARQLRRLAKLSHEWRSGTSAFVNSRAGVTVIAGDDHAWLEASAADYVRLSRLLEVIETTWGANFSAVAGNEGQDGRLLARLLHLAAAALRLENARCLVES